MRLAKKLSSVILTKDIEHINKMMVDVPINTSLSNIRSYSANFEDRIGKMVDNYTHNITLQEINEKNILCAMPKTPIFIDMDTLKDVDIDAIQKMLSSRLQGDVVPLYSGKVNEETENKLKQGLPSTLKWHSRINIEDAKNLVKTIHSIHEKMVNSK